MAACSLTKNSSMAVSDVGSVEILGSACTAMAPALQYGVDTRGRTSEFHCVLFLIRSLKAGGCHRCDGQSLAKLKR